MPPIRNWIEIIKKKSLQSNSKRNNLVESLSRLGLKQRVYARLFSNATQPTNSATDDKCAAKLHEKHIKGANVLSSSWTERNDDGSDNNDDDASAKKKSTNVHVMALRQRTVGCGACATDALQRSAHVTNTIDWPKPTKKKQKPNTCWPFHRYDRLWRLFIGVESRFVCDEWGTSDTHRLP